MCVECTLVCDGCGRRGASKRSDVGVGKGVVDALWSDSKFRRFRRRPTDPLQDLCEDCADAAVAATRAKSRSRPSAPK